MDSTIQKRIDEWTREPFDEATRKEINDLRERGDEKELEERFYRTLEFGTGGLRGVLGAGTNRMNSYTVGMATQGLANYIKASGGAARGIVIARDSRRRSDEFARESAAILAGNGIMVYLFKDIAPTPFCSFAIRHLGALSGIVITASHNPPEYNGYKVYWDDGGQIVAPHDKNIIAEVEKIDSITAIKRVDFDAALAAGTIRYIDDEIMAAYTKALEGAALRKKAASPVSIAYTPLHGTGYRIIPRILEHFGFAAVNVEQSQAVPDGSFPTVKSPNPEERDALERVLALARATNADIVLATDPDADRMGVAFRDRSGDYTAINGNQIGTMLAYYVLSRARENGTLPANAAVIKTIVTTELQREIGEAFACRVEDVLTGFKWIAAKMKEYDQTGSNVFMFGGEESYGYLPVNFVRDKDAVSACYFFAEMADWLKRQNRGLQDFLDEIYVKHRLYLEDLHSLTLKGIDGMQKIGVIMESFRKNPPSAFAGTAVTRVDDIQNLVSSFPASSEKKAIPGLPASDVIQFFLADGSKITMRPSGTEPKIKFYFSVCQKVDAAGLSAGKEALAGKVAALKSDFLQKVNAL